VALESLVVVLETKLPRIQSVPCRTWLDKVCLKKNNNNNNNNTNKKIKKKKERKK
jgi:hypothetical protein